ncbi:MAG: ABC transporter ATP-binding protein [Deltaproteobacteria bacterium]|nr:ABC transporter ATP-binding protein [Deltaproteobacteria bacterium]
MDVLRFEGVSRRFGTVEAVRDLSFSVGAGQVVGLLGPNGAGKTTTLRLLTGSLSPTQGRVWLKGHDLLTEARAARRHLGYLPESAPLYPQMRPEDWLRFLGAVHRMTGPQIKQAMDREIARLRLEPALGRPIGTLSRGFRQRVGLAGALLHSPALLVLDEPTHGLDPEQLEDLRGLIRGLGEERTVVLSSHLLHEVERTCDRALVLHRGALTGDIALRGSAQVSLVLAAPPSEAQLALLRGLEGVSAVRARYSEGEETTLEVLHEGDLGDAPFRWAAASGLCLLELRRSRGDLERRFHDLTGAPHV